jgi:hypothetical protein
VVGDPYENEVRVFTTNLKAEASAGDLNKRGRAPSVAGAARDDSLSVLAAYDKGTFLDAGKDCDAGGVRGDVVGDAFIGCSHEFVENIVGRLDALIEFLRIGGVRAEGHSGG